MIARFLVQSVEDKEEKQILAFRAHQNQNNNKRGRNSYQTQSRQKQNFGNRGQNENQNYGNNSQGNRGFFRGGFRGRGRGNFVRGNNSYYRRNSNFNGQQNHFLRVLTDTLSSAGGTQSQGTPAPGSSTDQQTNYRIPFYSQQMGLVKQLVSFVKLHFTTVHFQW